MKNSTAFEATYNIVAYLKGLHPDGHLRQAKVKGLRELQCASGEKLRPQFGRTLTLSPSVASGMPSILDKAFKGEL